MASAFKSVFGDALVTDYLECSGDVLPSPNQLKRRIIIKVLPSWLVLPFWQLTSPDRSNKWLTVFVLWIFMVTFCVLIAKIPPNSVHWELLVNFLFGIDWPFIAFNQYRWLLGQICEFCWLQTSDYVLKLYQGVMGYFICQFILLSLKSVWSV